MKAEVRHRYWLSSAKRGCFGGIGLQKLLAERINRIHDEGGRIFSIEFVTKVYSGITSRHVRMEYNTCQDIPVVLVFHPARYDAVDTKLDRPATCVEEERS